MKEKPISPWDDYAERKSPDGQYIAVFKKGTEITMGAPTFGELWIKTSAGSDHLVSDNAAASFVWSDDSRFLAFSVWRRNRKQNLCVLQSADMTVDKSPDEFRVLDI